MNSHVDQLKAHTPVKQDQTTTTSPDLSSQETGDASKFSASPPSLPPISGVPLMSLAMAGQFLSAASSTESSSHSTTPVESTPPKQGNSSQLPLPLVGISSAVDQGSQDGASLALSAAFAHDRKISSPESSKSASGSSTPPHPQHDLRRYHLNQQKLLSQHIQQQLVNPVNLKPEAIASGSVGPIPKGTHSATPSTYTSPPDSGRSSLEQSSSTRSGGRPRVLETHKLDIQTHTSGRRMVNQYVIEGELGRGVHGKVRLARDVETGERVAVKIVEREARKRLGAGLSLPGRLKRNETKERLQLSKINSKHPDADKDRSEPTTSELGGIAVSAAGTNETARAIASTPIAHFAPLPKPAHTLSRQAVDHTVKHVDVMSSVKDAERQREKDADKARKALLWTTDQKVRREIAIMKKCCHENVVSLREVIDDPQSKKVFMVLEYMEGGEVVWKDQHGTPTLTVDQSRSIVRDVVCGLEYLHYQGIIHRDIKPANLLWGKDRKIKISDFGVSHFSYAMMVANDHDVTAPTSRHSISSSLADDRELAKTAGSPAFFAPELCMASDMSSSSSSSASLQHSGLNGRILSPSQSKAQVGSDHVPNTLAAKRQKITKAIDVWALGVTLYCLLFGHTPFTAESEYALFAVIPSTDYSIPIFMGSDKVRVGARKPRWKSQCQWVDEEADAQPQDLSELSPDVSLADLSEDARNLRDLLDRLLEKDQTKRITLEEVKKHPWVTLGLQDTPAWLLQTDPSQHPFVEISHADVEDALTGFSRLKQRVKKWQSKLLDSLGGGRNRSRSIISSSTFFTHQDQKTSSGASSPYQARGGPFDGSNASSPMDSIGASSNPSSSVRTSRNPSRAQSFFSRQKSAHSIGKKDGAITLKALSVVDPGQLSSSSHSTSVNTAQDTFIAASSAKSASPQQEISFTVDTPVTLMQRPSTIDASLMKPPVAQHRSSSRSASADDNLRPNNSPEIPQRRSSDIHAVSKRSITETIPNADLSLGSNAPLSNASPQTMSVDCQDNRHGSNSLHDLGCVKTSLDSGDRSSITSISHASRISGRHRLGDFLRGAWLTHSDHRQRSLSRPSTRDSSELHSKVLKDLMPVESETSSSGGLIGLSIDTRGAVMEAGARPQAGTPISAPSLIVRGDEDPRLSLEMVSDTIETPTVTTSFAAASQPSSPLDPQMVTFDNLGRRRHLSAALDTPTFEQDDVDLELDLSDDDLDDDMPTSGSMLVNSGRGWAIRQDNIYVPAVAQQNISDDSLNNVLTPSVEGGYNVFKPPYQHVLPPAENKEASAPYNSAKTDPGAEGRLLAIGPSMSADAAVLRKTTALESQGEILTSDHSSSTQSGAAFGEMTSQKSSPSRANNELASTEHASEKMCSSHRSTSKPDVQMGASTSRSNIEDSRFADADEEGAKAAGREASPTGPRLTESSDACFDRAGDDYDEDSDENGISFQAKKSSRMQTGGGSTTARTASNPIRRA